MMGIPIEIIRIRIRITRIKSICINMIRIRIIQIAAS